MQRLLFVLVTMFILGACSTPKDEKEEEVAVLEENDPFLIPYFDIVDALAHEDFEAVQKAGLKLYENESSDGVSLALTRMGRLIVEAPNFRKQREVLYQMGIVMPLYIEQHVLNDYPIYKYRCSNVLEEKEGVWFTRAKETINPYSGKKDECVELIDTIKPIVRD